MTYLPFILFLLFFAGCGGKKAELAWTSIDVNTPTQQGDAHLLTIDRTNFMLIDAGPRQAADKLISFIKNKKCAHIQNVIITHGHRDHYGGLVPLLNSGITVGNVYFNPPSPVLITNELWGCSDEEIEEICSVLRKKNIPLKAIDKSTEWVLEKNAVLRVICAFDGINPPVGRTDINDTSTVIMLTHKNIKILFAADLNHAVGNYLATSCPPDMLHADILKFPHHGTESFAGDNFFAAVNPKVVIVPAPKELWFSERSGRARRLTEKIKTYVNGIHGEIIVVSDGSSFQIYSGRLRPLPTE